MPIPEFELGLTKMKLDEPVENCDEMVTCTETGVTSMLVTGVGFKMC